MAEVRSRDVTIIVSDASLMEDKEIPMRKEFILSLIASLAFCTSMGLAVPQSAQKPSQQPPPRGAFERGDNLMGTVSSVGADRIEIKKQDGTAQVVMVTGETHYRQGQQDIALEDLKPGDRISARVQTN